MKLDWNWIIILLLVGVGVAYLLGARSLFNLGIGAVVGAVIGSFVPTIRAYAC